MTEGYCSGCGGWIPPANHAYAYNGKVCQCGVPQGQQNQSNLSGGLVHGQSQQLHEWLSRAQQDAANFRDESIARKARIDYLEGRFEETWKKLMAIRGENTHLVDLLESIEIAAKNGDTKTIENWLKSWRSQKRREPTGRITSVDHKERTITVEIDAEVDHRDCECKTCGALHHKKSPNEVKMKFRKKPVVIEARELTPESIEQVAKWCHGSIRGTSLPATEQELQIPTLEGEMRAQMGDWIIQGVKGEFYPCKPDIFLLTYETAEE